MPADHHVAAGVPAEHQPLAADRVLAPVGEAHQPAAGGPPAWGGGADGRKVGEGAGVEELGVPDAAVVDGEDLVRADLDLVAVEHRGGVGARAARR